MPKYMFAATYTKQGLEGIRSAGGQSRIDAIGSMAEGVGGKLESFYFAFGDVDAYVIVDLPDDETAASVALTVGASGAAGVRTTKLLTAAQVDAAIGKTVGYRPPGS
jgi:uncharacterized protein with GYD domain